MDEKTGYPSNNGITRGGPLRVVLLSEEGRMYSLWLPAVTEGRYQFNDSNDHEEASCLSFEPVNGVWHVLCSGSARIAIGDQIVGQKVALSDKSLMHIVYNNTKSVLYVETEDENSNVFHSYYIERQMDIRIGRNPDCDICYPNSFVSRRHAILRWENNTWRIYDNNSRNGVFLNGKSIESYDPIHKCADVSIGDIIYIMGLRVIMGEGFIALNDGNQRVLITSPRLHRIINDRDADFSRVPINQIITDFKRAPRRRKSLETETIDIEMPPMPMTGNNIPLLLRVGSPLVMGGRALMGGNIAMMLTSMLFPVLTSGFSEKERHDYEVQRKEKYTAYLKVKEEEIQKEQKKEKSILDSTYPELATVLRFVDVRDRLWERRKTDDDFLKLRIGNGTIPMIAQLEYQRKKFEIDPDPLEEQMYDLVEKPYHLDNAPIMLSLTEDFLVGVHGTTKTRNSFISNLLIRIAMLHSCDEVKIVLLAAEKDMPYFQFASYLPHCWNDEMNLRFIASSKADAGEIGKYIGQQFSEILEKPPKLEEIIKTNPYYIIFALDRNLLETVEILKKIPMQKDSCGISLIAAFDDVPVECSKLIELQDRTDSALIDLKNAESDDQLFNCDYVSKTSLDKRAKQLAHILRNTTFRGNTLPKMLTFLAMFNAGKVEHLNPLRRWAENNPVKSLAVPVGVGADGEILSLDLHQKYQGPHGLVAGMTGSGKSEFIITYILSMAVNYSPDEVAFVLIDYKGGGLTGAFEDERRGIHLPHLVGTITNLDGAAIQRSLMSINSELRRRQTLFNEAKSKNNEGTMDIYTYQKLYRAKKVDEPLPHLFIISDEFAELKQQQPEFMDELISTARIGRSLGVHLILATQKPSGVVNDQIWSNTKFRVCLRVQDRSDSMDMLKRPEAAELKDTGRFYLQVGYNEYFALGQSAWCGADYEPKDQVVVTEDKSVQFLDTTGQTVIQVSPAVAKRKSDTTQLVAIVQYLSDLAKREKIRPRRLWLDPLPQKMELDDYLPRYYTKPVQGVSAFIGIMDDPVNQRQLPLTIDLQACRNFAVSGTSGSGKSSFLRTMLYSLINYYSPEEVEFCILDYSGGVLSPFRYDPHCIAYLTDKEEADVDRVLKMIHDTVEKRKKIFAEADVSNYDAYRRVAPMPLILFVIDGFSGLSSLKKGNIYYSTLHEFMRESVSCGVKTIISCSHLNEMHSRCKQEIQSYIGLHAKDRFDYFEILNVKTTFVPADIPGRGMCRFEDRALEYHTAILGCDLTEQEQSALLRERITEISRQNNYQLAADRLAFIDNEQSYADFCSGIEQGRIPLGFSREVKKVSMPLQQLFCMSLYFGNPVGVAPVLGNILFAAKRDHMKLLIVKRASGSFFDQQEELYDPEAEYLTCSEEGLSKLLRRINNEILERKVYRNEYCADHNLAPLDPGSMRKAAPYIRRFTQPLLVLFESYLDFCKNATDECLKNFPVIYDMGKGYNFYFVGCFYAEDGGATRSQHLAACFNKDNFQLFFGGRYNQQAISMAIPTQYSSINKVDPEYNKFLMRYQEEYYDMFMPCGQLRTGVSDPDEEQIV